MQVLMNVCMFIISMLQVIIYENGWWCVWLTYNNRLRELFCQVVPDNPLKYNSILITAPVVLFTKTPKKLLTGLLSSPQLSFHFHCSPPVAR